MPKPDAAQLAAALRDNLRLRKDQRREPVDSGADEEGDGFHPAGADKPEAWVAEGSKKL